MLVNYVLPTGDIRPMLVTVSYPETKEKLVDGIVFRNGSNDDRKDGGRGELMVWKVSVYYDELKRPGTWHEAN